MEEDYIEKRSIDEMYIAKQNLLHTIQSHLLPLFSPFLLDIVVNFFSSTRRVIESAAIQLADR